MYCTLHWLNIFTSRISNRCIYENDDDSVVLHLLPGFAKDTKDISYLRNFRK